MRSDGLQPVRQPGKTGHALGDLVLCEAERGKACGSCRGILGIMRPGKRCDTGDGGGGIGRIDDAYLAAGLASGVGKRVQMRSGADHDKSFGAGGIENAGLGRDIAFHAAMPCQMVRRDVQQHRDISAKGRGGFELVGGQFQHDHPVRPGVVQIAGGIADVPADGDSTSGTAQAMACQRGGCRFAIGSGDRHDPRLRRGAHGDFDLADHLDTCLASAGGGGVRLRVRMRDAGADHHRGQLVPGPVLPAA